MNTERTIKSAMYKVYELRDSMLTSIKNAKKVVEQQTLLTTIVGNANEAEEFKDFIKSVNESISNLNKQIETMQTRIDMLAYIISMYEQPVTQQATATIASMLLYSLGVVEPEFVEESAGDVDGSNTVEEKVEEKEAN